MIPSKPYRGTQLNRSHPLCRGLVGCWVMNEGSGSKVFDLSGGVNSGTITDTTVTRVTTTQGPGIEFSGNANNHRIDLGSIPASNPLNLSTENKMSIAAKVYLNTGTLSNSNPRLIDKSDNASMENGWGMDWRESGDNFQFFVDTGKLSFTATSSKGEWHSVGVSFDNRAVAAYINGILDSTGSIAKDIPSDTTNAAIGNQNHDTDRQWDGFILYVYVWNRPLLAGEFAWVAREPFAMFEHVLPIELIYLPVAVGAIPQMMYYYQQQSS